jgi:hypothetical protein
MRWTGHAAPIGVINAYAVIVREAEWKRKLGRNRSRWKNNVNVDLKITGG